MKPPTRPYIRDIKWPTGGANPPAPNYDKRQTENLSSTPVPVRVQPEPEAGSNPISSQTPLPLAAQTDVDAGTDQLLKDVSSEVKKQSAEPNEKKSRFGFKKSEEVRSGPQTAKTQYKLPIAVAVIVALILVVAAFSAFKPAVIGG